MNRGRRGEEIFPGKEDFNAFIDLLKDLVDGSKQKRRSGEPESRCKSLKAEDRDQRDRAQSSKVFSSNYLTVSLSGRLL
jgi:hypothetical protein